MFERPGSPQFRARIVFITEQKAQKRGGLATMIRANPGNRLEPNSENEMIDSFIYWCMGLRPPYCFLVFILTLALSCVTGLIFIAIAIDWFNSKTE